MKKQNWIWVMICMMMITLMPLTGALAETEAAGSVPDYSQKSCWFQIPEITKDVDTFYISATEYMLTSFEEGASDYAAIDNPEMREMAAGEYKAQASVFADSTNVFMPFYRQAGLLHAGEVWIETGSLDDAISGIPYSDVTAALDYYFENYNNGRPFIIASHSQGSCMAKMVLKKYFKDHPDYYNRMVAAYLIGYSVTKEDLEENPHMKFATGESDTGVIISWNVEGPESYLQDADSAVLLPGAISINPLNWKLDDTYAPASENLGSYIPNEETGVFEIVDAGADAQVIPERGVVVTHAKEAPLPEGAREIISLFFGPDGRHARDYGYYYNNIKDNVAKRIAAFQANK